jgi:hypothetical protein
MKNRTTFFVKCIHSEKATKFCEFFTVDLTVTTYDKSMVEILLKFVAFSEYMNYEKYGFGNFNF